MIYVNNLDEVPLGIWYEIKNDLKSDPEYIKFAEESGFDVNTENAFVNLFAFLATKVKTNIDDENN